MKIKIKVKNEILGDSIFWEGDSSKISEIRNVPARMLAEAIVKDGNSRKDGMWVVSVSEED